MKTIDKIITQLKNEAKSLKQSAINHASNKDMKNADKQWDKAEGVLHAINCINFMTENEMIGDKNSD